VRCIALQSVAECCSVLQSVAVWCNVVQCAAGIENEPRESGVQNDFFWGL